MRLSELQPGTFEIEEENSSSLRLSDIQPESIELESTPRTFGPDVGPPTEAQTRLEKAANMEWFPGGARGYVGQLSDSAAPMTGARLVAGAAKLPLQGAVAPFRRVPVREVLKEAAEPFKKAAKVLSNPAATVGASIGGGLGLPHLPKLPAKEAAVAGAALSAILNPAVLGAAISNWRSGKLEDLRKQLLDSLSKEGE